MDVYRITTRFDLSRDEERRAAEYLKSLKYGEGNRFVVKAVLARIDGSGDQTFLEQLRQMLREELGANAVTTTEHMAEMSADESILDDLRMFD